jgi:hypothetical protein
MTALTLNSAAQPAVLSRVASIVFGLIGALYWCKAGYAKITTRDNNPHKPDNEARSNADREGHRVLYTSTMIEQSRLNKIAAIHTAIAVLCQAAALLFEIFKIAK